MATARAPPAGFEQPFEVLESCHERIQRMLRRLQWLRIHLASIGRDDQARQAASDVMRYFDLAAPAHHDDEECHVFPPLPAAGTCVDTVVRLQREHLEMAALWPQVRELLQHVDADGWPGFALGDEGLLEHFSRLHAWHLAAESELVYPAAGHGASTLRPWSRWASRWRAVVTCDEAAASDCSGSGSMSFASDYLAQLKRFAQRGPLPRMRALHLPPEPAPGEARGEFCALELDDGSLGLRATLNNYTDWHVDAL